MSKPTKKRITVETVNGYSIKQYIVSADQAVEVMRILDGMLNEK